jgi:hypothetical protein
VTDQELRDTVASLADSLKESARQIDAREQQLREQGERFGEILASLAESQKESDRRIDAVGRQIGGLSDKFGSYTEGLALPSMTKILTQRFHMDVVAARARAQRNGRTLEVDVLAYSDSGVDEVYVVEVKSHLRQEAIVQMKTILREFHEFFPGHRGKKVYGILAAVDAPDGVRKKALQEGIYLARIHDGQFELQVPDDFQPRGY